MELRCLEELQDSLDKDLSWRKLELTQIKELIECDFYPKTLLRAGLAILCAHFEGFIRNASNYYVIFVSGKKYKLKDLNNNFFAIKFKSLFKDTAFSEKVSVYKRLIDEIDCNRETQFEVRYSASTPIISTESSPSSSILDEILKSIGITSDIFESHKTYIDYNLLLNRNKIVHGEREELNKIVFMDTYNKIWELLDQYKNLILESAENKEYKKNKG